MISTRSGRCQTARPIEAVLRARVSTKEQENEGYSIQAQCSLLRDYAAGRGIVIVEEFVDAESSKIGDADGFTRMIEYLNKHPRCRTILVEKTDRLYRNPKDWVTIDTLGVEVHFVKENEIISADSRSSQKFIHGMKVLMAKNYLDNLSEETLKGMTEKARSGFYPSYAPVGYRNAEGPGARRILVTDADASPVITELFTRFSTGTYSIRSLVKELNQEGFSLSGNRLRSSVVHQILRKRLYMGDFDWNGVTYQGNHEPLVTAACWQRVQDLLDTRAQTKTRKVKHDFAFTGVVRCGHCGCLMVGELKKSRYVYYHCTGNRGKCPEPYTRQEVLTTQFAAVLRELVIPQPVLDWLGDAVLESDRTEQAARQQSVLRLQAQHARIESRIRAMYLDKLDGIVAQDFYDQKTAEWRKEQQDLQRKIRDIQRAAPAPIDQAVDVIRVTSRASELFLEQTFSEQRRLLQLMIESATWRDGALRTTLFEPFEILRHSNHESRRKENENCGAGRDLEVWLPKTNTGSKTPLENFGVVNFSAVLTTVEISNIRYSIVSADSALYFAQWVPRVRT